mgnify:CR=1 FL=1|tara:strand:+ start:4478 stop:4705 length:228 start_codon:yes stop_codon:yes gene_type:complete
MSAKIKHAKVTAAHEGIAEMIVCIEFDNGGLSEVTLDAVAVDALMKSTNAASVDELMGASWERVRDALTVSYNRF